MRRRSRYVSDDERRLWRAAMHDIEPLRGRDPASIHPPAPTAADPAEPGREPSKRIRPDHRPKPVASHSPASKSLPVKPSGSRPLALDKAKPIDIDRRNWERLKRGDVKIDGRIDLHGMTQAEAHDRLNDYLQAMQAKGARCVLVITGMGRSDGGILRQMVPRWLAEPFNRQRLVTYTQAQLKHGGSGALYVLLKRIRPKG